jgi:hypothetical protein
MREETQEMATTYGEALGKIGATIPEHLVADAEVPILTGVQAQGDLIIVPAGEAGMDLFDVGPVKMVAVPDSGVQVVVGEATGNTHWLHRGFESPDVMWARVTSDPLVIGVVGVPEGQSAELIHTDEHGANAMGPGVYVIRGKREQADEIRMVAD